MVSQVTRTNAERVLIVEDEESTRSGLAELVRSWGYTADEACDGAHALERITEFRPTIIVSDLVMPRMSGIELLRAIRLRRLLGARQLSRAASGIWLCQCRWRDTTNLAKSTSTVEVEMRASPHNSPSPDYVENYRPKIGRQLSPTPKTAAW